LTIIAGLAIFSQVSVTVVLVIFLLYGQAVFGMILTAKGLFKQGRQGAFICSVAYLGTGVLQIGGANQSPVLNAVISLLPASSMTASVKVILGLEKNGFTLDWKTINQNYDNYSVLTGIITLGISSIFWTCVGLYFDSPSKNQSEKQREDNFENRIDVGEFKDVKITKENILKTNRAFETNYMQNKDVYEPVDPEVAKLEHDGQFMKV